MLLSTTGFNSFAVSTPRWHLFSNAVLEVSVLGLLTSAIFLALVLIATFRFKKNSVQFKDEDFSGDPRLLPPVSIFKPVHGMEARLEENLRSFFEQDYPDYEILIGARSVDDPAITVAKKLQQQYPHVKGGLVFSGAPEWPNAKVFTLSKMIPLSQNDYYVVSDSDVRVGPDFLRNVIPPLLDRKLGLVTCLYRGDPAADFWSRL